jgi:hypothetical protein
LRTAHRRPVLDFLIVAWLGSGFDYAVALYANWDWGRNFPHLKKIARALSEKEHYAPSRS